jgi:Tol biopolymer transport system component
MNRSDWLTDDLIQATFERRATQAAPRDLGDDILVLTAATSQRSAWRLRLWSALSVPFLRPAWIAILLLALILGAALALALVGHDKRPHHGLLAYVQDGDVYLANDDGSGAIRVVHDVGVAFSGPTWSPDGRWLALQGSGSEFLLEPTTLELRRVAAGREAVWSSDSQSLAFAASAANGSDVIQIVRIDTGAERALTPRLNTGQSLGDSTAWSPDGHWFLASTNASDGKRFVRIDAATGETVDIAPMPHLAEPGAHWSPESRQFAYARPEACRMPPCASAIVIEDADLSHSVSVSGQGKVSSSPVWSPDGTWIAFMSSDTVMMVRPDGHDVRAVLQTTAQAWSWSADGTALDFSNSDPSGGSPLGVFEVRVSDGALKTIAVPAGVLEYAWQVVPAQRPIPKLPTPASPVSSMTASIAPLTTPPAGPLADPTGSWSGIAIDGYCSVFEFDTMTPRSDGTVCHDTGTGLSEPDGAVFAPTGSSYALPGADGSLSIVRSDRSAIKAVSPVVVPSPTDFVQVDLAWSPDGRWLSIHRCLQDLGNNCVNPDSLILDSDGRSAHTVPGPASWSPDSRRLAMKAPNGDLLVGSPDGSDVRSIGTFPMPNSWSPDGTQFAFVRDGDAWIVNADGTGERNVTRFVLGGAYDAVWSPDGRYLAVVQESQLWIATLAGGDLLPVDLGPGRAGFYAVAPGTTEVAWSPDSTRLAVVVAKGDASVTIIVRTSDRTAISLGGTDIESVAWSPDGRFIALGDFSSGAIDIANKDGSGRHRVWTPPAGNGAGRMTWVP